MLTLAWITAAVMLQRFRAWRTHRAHPANTCWELRPPGWVETCPDCGFRRKRRTSARLPLNHL